MFGHWTRDLGLQISLTRRKGIQKIKTACANCGCFFVIIGATACMHTVTVWSVYRLARRWRLKFTFICSGGARSGPFLFTLNVNLQWGWRYIVRFPSSSSSLFSKQTKISMGAWREGETDGGQKLFLSCQYYSIGTKFLLRFDNFLCGHYKTTSGVSLVHSFIPFSLHPPDTVRSWRNSTCSTTIIVKKRSEVYTCVYYK